MSMYKAQRRKELEANISRYRRERIELNRELVLTLSVLRLYMNAYNVDAFNFAAKRVEQNEAMTQYYLKLLNRLT